MSTSRFMTATMCDDVRREEGNKVSHMGIYGPTLLLRQFPAVLPKLCFVMSVIDVGSLPPPQSIVFRLERDDELIGEVVMENASLAAAPDELTADGEGGRHTYGAVLQFFPLQLEGPCVLRARALVDGQELNGGSWRVSLLG